MIIGKHEDDVGPFASYRTWEKKESKAAKGEEGMVHDEPPAEQTMSLWTSVAGRLSVNREEVLSFDGLHGDR